LAVAVLALFTPVLEFLEVTHLFLLLVQLVAVMDHTVVTVAVAGLAVVLVITALEALVLLVKDMLEALQHP
jgi:hypothetical protein